MEKEVILSRKSEILKWSKNENPLDVLNSEFLSLKQNLKVELKEEIKKDLENAEITEIDSKFKINYSTQEIFINKTEELEENISA